VEKPDPDHTSQVVSVLVVSKTFSQSSKVMENSDTHLS